MPRKQWIAEYEGLKVRFVNQWSFSGHCTEELYINDQLMSRADVNPHEHCLSESVYGRHIVAHRHNDRKYEIEVRAGCKWPGFFMGCHIYIDGNLVGGDVNSKLMFSSKSVRDGDPGKK